MSSPSHVFCSIFGDDVFADLTIREVNALATDVLAIVNDERRTMRDACLVLRTRIGGPQNLKSYCQSLTAGERRQS